MPDEPGETVDAAHAAIGGVQSAIDGLTARLDAIVNTQAEMLGHLARLEPIKAAETEVGGTLEAVNPESHEPPPTVPNEPGGSAESPLRKLHNVLG